MKKLFRIFLIITFIGFLELDCSFINTHAQKTQSNKKSHSTTKRKSTKAVVPAIGSFRMDNTTYTLLLNDKIKCSDKCYQGTYHKLPNGCYVISWTSTADPSCGDYMAMWLITGDDVYIISEGTSENITDFVYDPETDLVTILEIEDSPATEDMIKYAGLPSNQLKLSYFTKAGSVEWENNKPQVSSASINDALKEYEGQVNWVYEEFYYEGEFEAPMGSGWAAIAPVRQQYTKLKELETSMNADQKAKFERLNNKIKAVLGY